MSLVVFYRLDLCRGSLRSSSRSASAQGWIVLGCGHNLMPVLKGEGNVQGSCRAELKKLLRLDVNFLASCECIRSKAKRTATSSADPRSRTTPGLSSNS